MFCLTLDREGGDRDSTAVGAGAKAGSDGNGVPLKPMSDLVKGMFTAGPMATPINEASDSYPIIHHFIDPGLLSKSSKTSSYDVAVIMYLAQIILPRHPSLCGPSFIIFKVQWHIP